MRVFSRFLFLILTSQDKCSSSECVVEVEIEFIGLTFSH